MKYCVYLLCIVFFITSIRCSTNESSEDFTAQTITVDPNEMNHFNYSKLFTGYELICFSGNNSAILIKPEKIVANELGYFLESSDAIYFYDKSGIFKSVINRRGTGPGEYLTISDFIIDLNTNTIEINDGETKKILQFNLEGKFINEYSHHINSYSFAKISNDKYLLNSGRLYNYNIDYSLNLFNINLKEIEFGYNAIDNNLKYLNFIEYANFSHFGDTLSYSSSISNKIYSVDSAGMHARVALDFKSNNVPIEYYERFKDLTEFISAFKKTNYVSIFDGYQESLRYMFISYSFQNKRPFLIIDKKYNKIYNFNSYEDDLLFPSVFQKTGYDSLPCLIDDHYFYVFIDSYKFIELFENLKNNISNDKYLKYIQNNSQAYNIYKNISPEDNPILIKYKLN